MGHRNIETSISSYVAQTEVKRSYFVRMGYKF
jgi:hypothetical protein